MLDFNNSLYQRQGKRDEANTRNTKQDKMDTKLLFGCLFSFIFTLLFEFGRTKLSPEQCSDLGYSSNLLCGSCDDLKEFKLSATLDESCRNCCEAGKEENSTQRHAKITLKVCQ